MFRSLRYIWVNLRRSGRYAHPPLTQVCGVSSQGRSATDRTAGGWAMGFFDGTIHAEKQKDGCSFFTWRIRTGDELNLMKPESGHRKLKHCFVLPFEF